MEIKIKTRYISKEFFTNFIFAIAITIFIFSLDALFQVIEVLVSGTFYPVVVSCIFLLALFSSFLYIIPLSFFYATSALFSRLAVDREILIFSSSGINPYRLTGVLFIFALIGSLFLFFFNFFILPEMSYKKREMIHRLQFKNPLSLLREKNTTTDIPGVTIYIGKISHSYKIKNISITYKDMGKTHFLKAERGSAGYNSETNEMIFNLQNGFLIIYDSLQTISRLDFTNYRFVLPLPDSFGAKHQVKPKVYEMRLAELLANNGIKEKIEIHKRMVFSVIPIVFILIAASIGIKLKQESKLLHIGIGGGIAMLFLQLIILGEILTYKTGLPVFIWTPVFLFLVAWGFLR
ncbi:MAG: LptF/LptG family permease [Candidatus Ratteibacteria bacterium]|nr:LptF/LptG family permease [Candidatus Ratteibacteria bacterium]